MPQYNNSLDLQINRGQNFYKTLVIFLLTLAKSKVHRVLKIHLSQTRIRQGSVVVARIGNFLNVLFDCIYVNKVISNINQAVARH